MPVSDQGVSSNRYTFIPRVLVFATREDKILLLKGAPTKKIWPNQYNGVGGHIEKGESIPSAADREFFEETGLTLTAKKLAAIVTIDTATTPGINMYVFLAKASTGEPIPSAEGTLEWVPISSLDNLPLVEDLPILIPTILSAPTEDLPLIAHYNYDPNNKLVINFF